MGPLGIRFCSVSKESGDHIRPVVLIVGLFNERRPPTDILRLDISALTNQEVDRSRVCDNVEKGHSLIISGVDVGLIGEKKRKDLCIALHIEKMDRLEFMLDAVQSGDVNVVGPRSKLSVSVDLPAFREPTYDCLLSRHIQALPEVCTSSIRQISV